MVFSGEREKREWGERGGKLLLLSVAVAAAVRFGLVGNAFSTRRVVGAHAHSDFRQKVCYLKQYLS